MTLRIEIADEREGVVFTLAGRIEAEQIPELQRLLRSEFPCHRLALDLTDVKLVDRDAVRFLAQVEAEGAKLRNCAPFVREWISQERNGLKTKAQKVR